MTETAADNTSDKQLNSEEKPEPESITLEVHDINLGHTAEVK